MRSPFATLLTAAAALAVAAGCSSAGSPAAGTFPTDPLLSMDSDSGALHVEVRTSPQPPARGNNTLELTITNAADGSPRDDVTVTVKPWMPSMNHGSSAIPSITPEGGGKYLVEDVDLFMPGHWEIRTTLTTGAATDHATPAIDVS